MLTLIELHQLFCRSDLFCIYEVYYISGWFGYEIVCSSQLYQNFIIVSVGLNGVGVVTNHSTRYCAGSVRSLNNRLRDLFLFWIRCELMDPYFIHCHIKSKKSDLLSLFNYLIAEIARYKIVIYNLYIILYFKKLLFCRVYRCYHLPTKFLYENNKLTLIYIQNQNAWKMNERGEQEKELVLQQICQ